MKEDKLKSIVMLIVFVLGLVYFSYGMAQEYRFVVKQLMVSEFEKGFCEVQLHETTQQLYDLGFYNN